MLQVTTPKKSKRPPSDMSSAKSAPASAPPVIVAAPRPQHPVYGSVPMGRDGFVLERQLIQMLNYWHEKAIQLSKEMLDAETADNPIDKNKDYDVLYEAQWAIYEAAFKVRISRSSDVAVLMQIVSRQVADCGDIECALNAERFSELATKLAEVTQPLRPKKPFRQLSRGRKLTQTGLLVRYQSFLIKELETLSWVVYGSRDYAKGFSTEDDAVNARCRSKRHHQPFFDEQALPRRARSVMKSLEIDTERVSEREMLPKSKRVSYDDACKKVEAH